MIDLIKAKQIYTELSSTAIDWIFPRACPVCGELIALPRFTQNVKNEYIPDFAWHFVSELANTTRNFYNEAECGICAKCYEKLNRITGETCVKCGKPLENRELCESCASKMFFFDMNIPVFVYDEIMRKSIHEFKYSFNPQAATILGRLMGIKLLDIMQGSDLYGCLALHKKEFIIIPVPLHRTRLKKRGYNQAEILAKEVSKILNIPLRKNCVARTKKTVPQSEILLKREREENVKDAFSVLDSEAIKGKYVLIVDDIYTTGSTINELAKTVGALSGERIFSTTLSISATDKHSKYKSLY